MVTHEAQPSESTGNQIARLAAIVAKNKFGQVEEKSFNFVLRLFGFVEVTKFRDLNEYSDCVQNVWAKSCLPCQCYV